VRHEEAQLAMRMLVLDHKPRKIEANNLEGKWISYSWHRSTVRPMGGFYAFDVGLVVASKGTRDVQVEYECGAKIWVKLSLRDYESDKETRPSRVGQWRMLKKKNCN